MGIDHSVQVFYGFIGNKDPDDFIKRIASEYDAIDLDYEISEYPDEEVLRLCGYKYLVYTERLSNFESGEWAIAVKSSMKDIDPQENTGVWLLNANQRAEEIAELVDLRDKLGVSTVHEIGWYLISSAW